MSVFCSSHVSIDGRMFEFSIGASTLGLGELTESNEPVCGDAMPGLWGNGLPVVMCLLWHCQSWSSYIMVYEYPKKIYLLTNISHWTKTLKVLKSPKHVIQNIYIFKVEWTTVIEIIIGSTSNTVFSSKNDGIK
jgi:hypothetical protein